VKRILHGAAAVVLTSLPTLAAAAEEAAEHHHEAHGIPWPKLIFSTINLAIFLAILARFVWPNVKDLLRSRRADIVDLLEKASKAKAEAEQLKREWESRMANVNTELEALRRQAEADIAGERQRILEATQKVADAIRRDAARTAEQEVRNAEAMLRQEVAAQATAVAKDLARQRVGADEQRRLVSEFIGQVRS
jgi:F-type H+-transporting ATPase subunit b